MSARVRPVLMVERVMTSSMATHVTARTVINIHTVNEDDPSVVRAQRTFFFDFR